MNFLADSTKLIDRSPLPQPQANQDTLSKILTLAFITIGAVAVLIIVIAGLQYITARSSPERVASARNKIIYALVGLIIAASASAIVNFVIGRSP